MGGALRDQIEITPTADGYTSRVQHLIARAGAWLLGGWTGWVPAMLRLARAS